MEGQSNYSACAPNCLCLRLHGLKFSSWSMPPNLPVTQESRVAGMSSGDTFGGPPLMKTAQIYSQHKPSLQPFAGLQQPVPVLHCPCSNISLEFVSSLPPSKGNMTILTIVDSLKQPAHFLPLPKFPLAKEMTNWFWFFQLHSLWMCCQIRGPNLPRHWAARG